VSSAKIVVRDLTVRYGSTLALDRVALDVGDRQVTALIGPSGAANRTFLRCLNRMNDHIRNIRIEGSVSLDGVSIYDAAVDPVELRRRVGMVFQKSNPFPKSIFDNVAFGPRVTGCAIGSSCARSSSGASGRPRCGRGGRRLEPFRARPVGRQQQRLCIARGARVEPDVPAYGRARVRLDPIATPKSRIDPRAQNADTIVIVTTTCSRRPRAPTRRPTSTRPPRRGGADRADLHQSEPARDRGLRTGRFG